MCDGEYIKLLESAIRKADYWVGCGEGVGLLHYYEGDWMKSKEEYELIKRLLSEEEITPQTLGKGGI